MFRVFPIKGNIKDVLGTKNEFWLEAVPTLVHENSQVIIPVFDCF